MYYVAVPYYIFRYQYYKYQFFINVSSEATEVTEISTGYQAFQLLKSSQPFGDQLCPHQEVLIIILIMRMQMVSETSLMFNQLTMLIA
jgi:hypothetical protein